MQCLFMMAKINYHLIGEKIIADLQKNDRKPRLLLHACCAPCSSYPLTYLCPYFDVTIYYANSNIYPQEEYLKRLNELKKFLKEFEKKEGFHIDLVIPPYNLDDYQDFLANYIEYPEGSLRCFLCYEKRMDESYEYASKNHFDYFTTTLSVSRFKNSLKINEIGAKLEKIYPNTKYFYSDFKKNNGNLIVKKMKEEYSLYQQQYCGCKYSLLEREKHLKK